MYEEVKIDLISADSKVATISDTFIFVTGVVIGVVVTFDATAKKKYIMYKIQLEDKSIIERPNYVVGLDFDNLILNLKKGLT